MYHLRDLVYTGSEKKKTYATDGGTDEQMDEHSLLLAFNSVKTGGKKKKKKESRPLQVLADLDVGTGFDASLTWILAQTLMKALPSGRF